MSRFRLMYGPRPDNERIKKRRNLFEQCRKPLRDDSVRMVRPFTERKQEREVRKKSDRENERKETDRIITKGNGK